MAEPLTTVGAIAEVLDKVFPLSNAAPWDKNGLRVGNKNTRVKGVVFALEPSIEVLDFAIARGANVLVTHHPLFLDAPERLDMAESHLARMLDLAFKHDIALINAHTNLDAAPDAKCYIGKKLGLIDRGDLLPTDETGAVMRDFDQPAYARLWASSSILSLAEFESKLGSIYDSPLTIWGDPRKKIETIVTASGSGSSRIGEALAAKADLIISGEISYHAAVPAVEMGLALIELGHDVSEWTHVPLLRKAIMDNTFVPHDRLFEAPHKRHWRIKEGT